MTGHTLRTRLMHVAHYLITMGGKQLNLDRADLVDGTIERTAQESALTVEQLREQALLELADLAVGDAARRAGARFGNPDYRHPIRTSDGKRQLRLFEHLPVLEYASALDRKERHAFAELASVQIHRPIADRAFAVCAEHGLDPAEATLAQVAKLASDLRTMLDNLDEGAGAS